MAKAAGRCARVAAHPARLMCAPRACPVCAEEIGADRNCRSTANLELLALADAPKDTTKEFAMKETLPLSAQKA